MSEDFAVSHMKELILLVAAVAFVAVQDWGRPAAVIADEMWRMLQEGVEGRQGKFDELGNEKTREEKMGVLWLWIGFAVAYYVRQAGADLPTTALPVSAGIFLSSLSKNQYDYLNKHSDEWRYKKFRQGKRLQTAIKALCTIAFQALVTFASGLA